MPTAPVLVLNAGSSSLKFATFRGGDRVHAGTVERVASGGHADALRHVPSDPPAAVGHRVVHGGDRFTSPVVVTDDVVAELERLSPLAPLHEPQAIAVIRAVAERFPAVPQVACFDTAFHATMPVVERMYGLPRRLFDAGIKRYGFHGLAYESVVRQLRERGELPARLVACHLGSGASLCAVRDGRSVATTMGFTPLDGLLMGTRPGNLDPGVVLYLERHDGLTPDAVDRVLSKESGLLGVSGVSADMRDLLASPDPRAAEAVELFCYRVAREIGAMAAALGGADAVAFSGGIGEHAAEVRDRIVARLGWLGPPRVYVVPADEEAVIAGHVRDVLGVA